MLPLIIHLVLVLIAGLYLPGPLVAWFQNVARMLG
jgi:hydrogenase-4 component F